MVKTAGYTSRSHIPGQYHWVSALAPQREKVVASWFTGWISVGGQIVLTASAAFAAGLQFQALITLNHPDTYVPQRWQGMMFYWLVLLYAAAVNIWGSKILPHTNLASGKQTKVLLGNRQLSDFSSLGVLHIVGFLAIIIVLGVMAPKHSAHYVFVEVSNSSGWSSDGVAWLVGLLSSVYPFLGYVLTSGSPVTPGPRTSSLTHVSGTMPLPTFRKRCPIPAAMYLSQWSVRSWPTASSASFTALSSYSLSEISQVCSRLQPDSLSCNCTTMSPTPRLAQLSCH